MHKPLPDRCLKRWAGQRPLIVASSTLALVIAGGWTGARALDLDIKGIDGLNTETVANRERLKVWDNAERYGANPVSNMERRDLTPDGIRMGNYMVIPNLGTALVFDDNIFGIDTDRRSDWRTEITPSLQLKSQLPRHVLDLSLDGKIVTYFENEDQNYENYRAKVDTALHYDHAHTLSLSLSTLLKHEERDDPIASYTAAGPISVFEHRAATGITRDVGRLYGTLATSVERRDYVDTTSIYGEPLDQDPRDTDTYSAGTKIGYRFSPGFEFVTKVRLLKSDNRGDDEGDRDSWGYEAVAGLVFETNPLLKWRILGGYGIRDYRDDALEDINTNLLQADVQWLPTQRLTIYGTLSRHIEEALDLSSSGLVETSAKVRADYELYHNLVLSGALEYRHDEFIDVRTDDIVSARVGLDYYFSKNWLFTFGYEHQIRDSTDDSLDMHRNRFMVGAKLRF